MLIQKIQLFSAFICANNIGSVANNLFGVMIFNPVPVLFLFERFNFLFSAIVSSGSNFTFSNFTEVIHLHQHQELTFQVYLQDLSFLQIF